MDGEPDLYIDGKWRHACDGGTREIINPADGSVAAVVDEATPDDARDAVAAARKAFDDRQWPATPVTERAALLDRVVDLLSATRSRSPSWKLATPVRRLSRAASTSTMSHRYSGTTPAWSPSSRIGSSTSVTPLSSAAWSANPSASAC